MRLTLRTLLAYMDEILESEDQQQLREKIETSDYAGDLVHRARDSMRRLRLSAPQVLGASLGLDPNSVAEYLDNTLPVEHVADLERICLESDLHLAEVVSCHHVLTMVLGQPADVDPDVRARMYAIPESAKKYKRLWAEHPQAEQQATDPTVEKPVDDVPLSSQADQSGPSQVPDYLRTSRRGPLQISVRVVVTVAALIAVGYFGLTWFESPRTDHQEVAGVAANSNGPVVDQQGEIGPLGGVESTDHSPFLADPPVEVSLPQSNTVSENATSQGAPAAGGSESMPLAEGSNSAARTMDLEPTELESEGTAVTDSSEAPGAQTTGAISRSEQHTPATIGLAGSAATPLAAGTGRDLPNNISVVDPQNTVATTAEDNGGLLPPPGEPTETPSSEPTETPSSEPAEIGTFWANRSVLLRLDPTQEAWVPLATGTSLKVGDQLMTLPTFRPTIALHSGIGIELSGAASVKLGRSTPAMADPTKSIPLLEVVFGRVVLINSGQAGNTLVLAMNQVEQTIELGNGARLAIEVRRRWVPGCDPEVTSAPIEATAYAVAGGVDWADENGVVSIEVPAQWNFAEGEPIEMGSLDTTPFWLDGEPSSRLEQKAAEQIREHLRPGMPATTRLLELTGSRRKEVRALATQCGAYVGQFVPFVKALRDSDQRSVWPEHISTLRNAIAWSPNSAHQLRQVLVDQRGGDAATDLFEMFCGYRVEDIGLNPEEIKTGVLQKLIGWLENDNLDYRVLASHNLHQITGKNLLQNPAANPSDRTQGVRRWRQRLRQGDLAIGESYGD